MITLGAILSLHFPYYLRIGEREIIHPHLFFELLAYALAIATFLLLRSRFGDSLSIPLRWVVITAAVVGGVLGSKVLFWLEDPQLTLQNLHNPAYLMGGKTIVGGLVGGLFAVELMKRHVGILPSTGDLYAIPLALGIAIGRIGCFLTGLADNTYGTPTSLPWAVDFGDGIRRHPTQLYEAVFLLSLLPLFYAVLRSIRGRSTNTDTSTFRPGDVFKVFMVSYLSLRLLCDFIKPYPRIVLGLGSIQWACLLVLLYYSSDIARWVRVGGSQYLLRRRPT